MNQFYQKGHNNEPLTTEDREQTKKDWKAITVLDTGMIHMVVEWMKEKGIDFVCAPFKVEWQLVELESSRCIDGILLTTDGDIFPLGAKTVYLDTRFGDKSITAFHFTRDLAMNHVEYDKRQTDKALYSMQWYRDYIPELCALLGCDYIKRISCHYTDKGATKVHP